MTTTSPVPLTTPLTTPATLARLVGALAGPLGARLAPLASLVVPGLGAVLRGRVQTGVLILAGFAASAMIPVTVASVTGMFAFWLWGLTSAYEID